ncbi:pancreatic lipase-related protein 2-like [Aquarana catesbeiana]|uniref:pancreatic lipase-related protein 2-like n=1 Tax=Aquarana catesbeiana TaxID=8400 RepID=UPI003CC97377
MIVKLVLVLSIAAAIRAAEVYYDRLGRFTDEPPYCGTLERPICRLPQDPRVINTQFFLFTRRNPDQYQVISALSVSSVAGTNFEPDKNSIFIVHGAFEWGDKPWLVEMCQAFLKVSDVNCFCVDWRGGSFALYTQSSNNVRVVGAEIDSFLSFLQETYGYDMLKVYLIGHSLGAHVVGEAGRRKRGIRRASGLDAAGPYFENTPPEVRLDPTDAICVDAIHTDGPADEFHLGFGIQQTVGNVDHYVNGGKNNPGCEKITFLLENIDNIVEGVYETIFCNHHRSFMFFTESISRPHDFIGYPSSSYEDFLEGSGFPCTEVSCAYMGYKADEYVLCRHDQDSTDNQKFFLNTGEPPNSPRWRYGISITITGSNLVLGSISVALCGNECSSQHEIYSGPLSSGTHSSFIDVELDVNPVQMVKVSWHKSIISIFQSKLSASAVTVQYGPSGEMYEFCGGDPAEEDTSQILGKCSTL